MSIALWVVGGIAALLAVIVIVGSCLPRGHVASCAVRISKPPQAVWEAATDYAGWSAWAPDVKAMERLPDRNGHAAWRMVSRHGAMPWVVEADEPPRRRITRILDEGLPFGGTWTWTIEPDGDGCRVTLTENGFIRNVAFRALARFVFGYHATPRKFLAALAARLGDGAAAVERIA